MASKKSVFDLSPEKMSLLKRLREEGAGGSDAGTRTATGPIAPRSEKGPAPLSFAQQRLWFLSQMDPENPLYNLPGAVRLHGPLDETALRGALDAILSRHQALRTRFLAVAGEPFAEALPEGAFPLRLVDLRTAAGDARDRELLDLVTQEARSPFRLSEGPLARALLIRCGPEEHVLVVTIHHIATDGWSGGIIMKELSALYEAFHREAPEEAKLPELSIQYADFAAWQREWLTGDVLEEQLAFWRAELTASGEPSVLELPTDRPRPRRKLYRGGRVELALDRELSSKLRSLARDNGASLFMVLLAAFDVLLSRYTRQTDVVVGTSYANRNRREIESLVGFFVNTLALRTRLDDDPSFLELLGRVRHTVLSADAHQDVPFERVVEAIAPERDPGRNPFFEIVFDLQRAPRESFSLAGLTFQPFEFETGTTRFDLEAHLVDGKEIVEGFFRYDADLFDHATILDFVRHYRALLASAVATPSLPVGSLALMDDEERGRLEGWSETKADYPELAIGELFRRRAAGTPDAPAILEGGSAMTYRELDERSDALARHLVGACGVSRGGRVGVCLARSTEMITTLLGILKAGAVYVPLDASYPEERLAFMIADARLDAIVTRDALAARLPELPETLREVRLDADGEWTWTAAESTRGTALPEVGVEDLAYVIYTSGSTGRPKGVEVTHRGVVRLLFGVDYVTLGPEETILQLAPVSFDASTFEIWGALLHGGKLVLYPGTVPTTAELADVLAREKVSTLWLTASLFNAVVDEAPEALTPVRQLLVGGEALSVPHIARALEALPGTTLVNGYGPTESTTFTCCFTIPRSASYLEGRLRSIPIGRPIANTTVHLLDASLAPVPPGVVGDLYIGGDGLARGYAHRPELTAERFVPHPSPRPDRAGERLYRTGDLARLRADGVVEFLGRTDDQVKVRGFRIELGEIEAALTDHEGVKEAVALLRETGAAEKQLVAHVVGAPEVSGETLRSYLTARLPDYMVPAAIVRHEALPLSPNGKADRRALALIDPVEAEASRGFVPPRGPVEEGLAEIWSEALGLERERLGVHDSFFALGGHSLAAVKVLARIRESYRADVPLRVLFESPTLSELASRVSEAMGAGSSSEGEAEPMIVEGDPDRGRLSFAQQRLWLTDRLTPGGSSYNVAAALRLKGPLDVEALERALERIVERHESLRTTIEPEGQLQTVHEAESFRLERIDLTSAPDPEREAVRLAEDQARRPVDLVAGPLFAAVLVTLAETTHVLLWKMHHIVTDAWSIAIFYRELETLYRAGRAGERARLPEVRVQYRDFASWQARTLEPGRASGSLEYWRDVLSGDLVPTELPADHKREVGSAHRGARLSRPLPSPFGPRLRELGKQHGVTTFMTLLAAFDVLLGRHSGRDDVVVGTPVANRGRREIENTMGLFVNLLVLRVDLSGNPTFAELLERVRERSVGAFAHQDLPFERLVAELSPERRADRTPFFQVAFALQNALGGDLDLEGLEVSTLPVELTSSRFDFELHVWERGSRMGVVASYDRDLYSEATVARLLDQYETLLDEALRSPGTKLDALGLLSPSERERALEASRAPSAYAREATLDELFVRQVERTPDAAAVRFGETEWTYRELARRASRIAAELRARGVGPDVRVGVYGERSPELYAAVVGVTLAGGAYVPIDPSYPSSRVRFIVEDAKLDVILAGAGDARALPLTENGITVLSWGTGTASGDEEVAPAERPRSPLTASHLAYVVYTSGSTGTPKGVAVPHRGVTRLIDRTNYIRLAASDRVAQAASFSFDAATFELWGALLSGACLVGIDKNVALEPLAFGRELERSGVSVLFLTTALFNVMVREASRTLASLRVLLFGGESVDVNAVRACLDGGGPSELLHVYGPTESTTFASFHPVAADVLRARTVPIGKPLANTELYVVDERFELCPSGVAGELVIGGDGLARGYFDRPELTAASFVPHPFSDTPGARLYRTGDVVRRLGSGAIEFVGRRDGQIKLRGHRIELGEVEAALAGDAAVREAVVVLREDIPGDKRLVGYVVVDDVATFSPSALRASLVERLPEYMVPQSLVPLEAIPLTANGKVDRAVLPAPDGTSLRGGRGEEGAESFTAPRNGLEEDVAALAREILGVERIGVHDNFFHLGGHSLLATELVSRVRKVFRVEVPLRDFFVSPTVETLARRIAERDGEDVFESGAPLLAPAPRDGRTLPVSFAQKRLWFVSELDRESTAYNMATAVRLSGALDPDALGRALARIVERHEVLRTVFIDLDGEPALRIAPVVVDARTGPLEIVDLTAEASEAREARARALVAEGARQPFDRAAGPLFRARLLRLDVNEHVLQIVLDHLIADGWSLGVLFRELGSGYRAFRGGSEPELPELAVQYSDFARWQGEWLSGARKETELAYWREALAGDLPSLQLPTDYRRPARASNRGGRLSRRLPAELVEAVRGLARTSNATLFMTLLAGFDALLHRYSGQTDIFVGSPVANRTRSETEPLIGLFANSLVLRADLSGDPSFEALVARVRESALGAYAHQDVPFEMLVEDLQPERDLGRNPIFQVTFALQSAPMELSLSGLTWRPIDQAIETARFDLELNAWETSSGIELVAFYSADLFRAETVELMLAHYERLLEAASGAPSTSISELPMLRASERESVLRASHETARELPGTALVHRLFERQVEADAEAVAIVSGEERVTYGELNRRANRLARRLTALGIRDEGRVGVFLERSAATVTALLAVLKAGGVYVPLDPDYPDKRLRFMLEDSAIRVVVTEGDLISRLPRTDVVTVSLDDAAEVSAIELENDQNLPSSLDLDAGGASLAYVIYTSGSTGTPKGVEVPHRGVVRLLFGVEYASLGRGTTILQLAPVSFDASTFEIWGALLHGGRIVLYPNEVPSAEGLKAILSREKVTTLWLTAALFNAVVDESPSSLATLRQLLVGGEALSVPHIARALEALPETEIINGYGPTESTTFTCCYSIPRTAATGRVPRSIPIGRPIANTEVYLLDAAFEPVPVGMTGDLYIGGAGLARGYGDRPELTASRFLPSPFAATPGERLYCTGDRARYLADGQIEFLGRADDQVKVRGFRIELGEVETVLSSHPAVRDAAVVVRVGNEETSRALRAYVVWNAAPELSELRGYLNDQLPSYMVPGVIVAVDALPLSPNGKVDRKALMERTDAADAEAGGDAEADGYVAPRSPIEELVANEWAQILGVERVGVASDFFEVGGHSLLATQLVSRIRKGFGVDFPLSAVFEYPTVAEQADRIAMLGRSGAETEEVPLEALPDSVEAIQLSYSQQRLWFFDQLDPRSSAYNMPFAVRMRGALDVAAFERGFRTVIERHAVLRSVFGAVDGRPTVRLLPMERFQLRRADLRGVPAELREREAERLAKAEARRPFVLREGPLVRGTLVSLLDEEHVLLLTIHHIVSDGWSMAILFEELDVASRAHARGEAPPLPALAIQYTDFAAWQRRWLDEGVASRQLAYWKEALDGAPDRLELPTDAPRPRTQTFRGGKTAVELPPELHRGLRKLSRDEGATLFMTLLAAFQILLARLSGQSDVVVGTPIAGRNRAEIEPLIGFFVNTLCLRASIEDDPTFRQILGRVRKSALGAYAHQDLPFDRLVEEIKPERDLSRTPLFQVMFNYLNLGGSRLTLSSVTVDAPSYIEPDSKFDLTLYAGEQGDELELTLVYNRDLFGRARMETMLAQLEGLLRQASEAPDTKARSFSLVSEGGRRRLPDPEAALRVSSAVAAHERFEENARRSPDRLAVFDAASRWTYGELDAAANRLAHFLRDRGIGEHEGDTVAVYAHRSASLVWALLGVWKAGAAFVVLDPAYPARRLAGYVQKSRAKGLIRLRGAGALPEELVASCSSLKAVIELGDGPSAVSVPPLEELPSSSPSGEPIDPDRLAYVAFTSGSTGDPKGVLGTHRPLAHFLEWDRAHFGLGAGDRFALTAGLSYDPLLRDVFAPLWLGATLTVPGPEVIERGRLRDFLREHETTVAHLTPTLGKLLASREGPGLPALRYVFFGGESATGADVERFREVAPAARLVNFYGTTETPQAVGYHEVDTRVTPGSGLASSAPVPIGKGIEGVQLLVLTSSGRLAGVGELGEIVVRTPYLTRGYLGDEALTRARFAAAAPDVGNEAGAYRTGDLGRFLPDGSVVLVGRADDQIQLRGFRIELGEIEAVLHRHPRVRSGAVLCRVDDGEARLVAYVVGDGDEDDALIEDVERHLARELPAHMVPAHFVSLPALPMTPNGKLDRKALPAPEYGDASAFTAPASPVEIAVAEIWETLLGVDRVGLGDNFFKLGGHSLLATQVVSRIRDAVGVDLPLRVMFEKPTAGALAAAVSEALLVSGEASGEMDAMLAEIEGLSEEELEAKLTEMRLELEPGAARSEGPGGEPSQDD